MEKARRIMRRAFLRAVWGECWGRKAVDGIQVTAVCRPMVCQPGRSVPHVNDAAGEEAVLLQQMLHGAVVGVGIRSDIPGNGLAVVRSTAEETVCPAVPGQTVDGEVGGVVPPGTLYPGIGGFGGIQQRKHPMYPGFIAKDPADALSDIGADQLRRRIGAGPTGWDFRFAAYIPAPCDRWP